MAMNRALRALAILLTIALAACERSSELAHTSTEGECAHCVTADESREASPKGSYTTKWLAPSERRPAISTPPFQNQEGRTVTFDDLRGAPVALSFIYTRCENERKCPLIARTIAALQAELERSNVVPRPRLALITYDPEYDTPTLLKDFGEGNGLRFTDAVMLLRPEPDRKQRLFEEFNVRVNFNDRGVNLHGVQLILLDKQGRFVRAHHTLIWDNDAVLADLKQLARE
jgi:cytochrome oxidase Cu insertion factor (SCO1/SenC/PrrC family)